MYLAKGEEIPGCERIAPKDGWYDPDFERGFKWSKYREWQRRKKEEKEAWEDAHPVINVNMNP